MCGLMQHTWKSRREYDSVHLEDKSLHVYNLIQIYAQEVIMEDLKIRAIGLPNDKSRTCISGSREAGREVNPASGHKADFLPDVHLQRHTAGQSVQSGKAAALDNNASELSSRKRASKIRPLKG